MRRNSAARLWAAIGLCGIAGCWGETMAPQAPDLSSMLDQSDRSDGGMPGAPCVYHAQCQSGVCGWSDVEFGRFGQGPRSCISTESVIHVVSGNCKDDRPTGRADRPFCDLGKAMEVAAGRVLRLAPGTYPLATAMPTTRVVLYGGEKNETRVVLKGSMSLGDKMKFNGHRIDFQGGSAIDLTDGAELMLIDSRITGFPTPLRTNSQESKLWLERVTLSENTGGAVSLHKGKSHLSDVEFIENSGEVALFIAGDAELNMAQDWPRIARFRGNKAGLRAGALRCESRMSDFTVYVGEVADNSENAEKKQISGSCQTLSYTPSPPVDKLGL